MRILHVYGSRTAAINGFKAMRADSYSVRYRHSLCIEEGETTHHFAVIEVASDAHRYAGFYFDDIRFHQPDTITGQAVTYLRNLVRMPPK